MDLMPFYVVFAYSHNIILLLYIEKNEKIQNFFNYFSKTYCILPQMVVLYKCKKEREMKKMKINGEEILYFDIEGEETGYVATEVKTLAEAYKILKEHKEYVRKYGGVKDNYYINCRTKTCIYGGYELKKYKNKLYLK